MLKFCISFFVLGLAGLASGDKCPKKEDIDPCTCEDPNGKAIVTCIGLQNVEELRKAVAGMKGRKIYYLFVKESYLGDVPGGLFKDTNIEELEFFFAKMTSIGDDQDPPFTGLEDSLRSLTIVEGFWDYDNPPLAKTLKLSHLKKLTYLNMENNVIPKLGDDWFENGPVTLRKLFITNGLVKEVGDKAFTSLNNLRSLHFTGNAVSLKRSALPSKPIYLHTLNLSGNRIENMPDGFFDGLSALKYLYLDFNGISTLPEQTWGQILKQLSSVVLNGNPLVCDSNIKWIIRNKLNDRIIGECVSPKSLWGRSFDSLTESDIAE